MSDRLPPGCNSADGGIDHGLEKALDDLCDDIETAEQAVALRALLPALKWELSAAYEAGLREGSLVQGGQ